MVGLGLIGGSLARDLAARGVRVLASDRDPEALAAASGQGIVAAALPPSLQGIEAAEVVVLALPVAAAAETLARVRAGLRAVDLIVDVGSTKRAIVAAAESLGLGERFVGCHPLAGDHRSGWGASREGLFVDHRVVLVPTATTTSAALEVARRLWRALGAHCVVQTAAEHDREVAWTSHLAQLAASALALALDEARLPAGRLGPGGAAMTRLAASSPEIWEQILIENADHVLEAADGLVGWLERFGDALREGDRTAVRRLLEGGRAWSREPGE